MMLLLLLKNLLLSLFQFLLLMLLWLLILLLIWLLLLSADVAARLAGELINLGLCRFQVFADAAPLLREQKT